MAHNLFYSEKSSVAQRRKSNFWTELVSVQHKPSTKKDALIHSLSMVFHRCFPEFHDGYEKFQIYSSYRTTRSLLDFSLNLLYIFYAKYWRSWQHDKLATKFIIRSMSLPIFSDRQDTWLQRFFMLLATYNLLLPYNFSISLARSFFFIALIVPNNNSKILVKFSAIMISQVHIEKIKISLEPQ